MKHRQHSRIARPTSALGLAILSSLAVPVMAGRVAEATAPVFANPPTRVYTTIETNLPFTGSDPITGQQHDVVVSADGDDSTCDVKSPGDDDWEGNCMGAQIEILEPDRGTLTINDANLDYSSSGQSGDSTFNVQGKLVDLQNKRSPRSSTSRLATTSRPRASLRSRCASRSSTLSRHRTARPSRSTSGSRATTPGPT